MDGKHCYPGISSKHSAVYITVQWWVCPEITSIYSSVPLYCFSLYLESIEMDHVLSESCYKGTILQRSYRKMTMLWSFSYNSFVKFYGKRFGIHNKIMLFKNP